MRIKLPKLALSFALVLAMGMVQSCQEKNEVKPQAVQSSDQSPSVLEEIKNLGFDAASIQDKGNYYLAEGDIYFAKNKTATRTLPERGKVKTKIPKGQRPVMTVGVDQAVAASTAWKNGVNHAIATWNADANHHFSFRIVESSDQADIFLQDDNGELSEDVEVASEFAAHGRVGSTIRVNLNYTASTTDQVKTKALEGLSHSVGLRHADFLQKNDLFKTQTSARTQVSSPGDYLYVIDGNDLYGVRPSPFDGYWVSDSWAGSSVIASTRSALYVVQFDVLYIAFPNGNWRGLTSGWSGTQCLVSVIYDSHSLYAMQNDWLYGVNADDGEPWLVTNNAGFSTPWSGTTAMCAYHIDRLAVLNRSNTASPELTEVNTNPLSPYFGDTEAVLFMGVSPSWAPKGLTPRLDESTILDGTIFIVDTNPDPRYFGLFASITFGAIYGITSDQIIDYSKTQSLAGDFKYIYLLADGGLFTYGLGALRGNSLTTILPPHYLRPTAIMTNYVRAKPGLISVPPH